MTAIGAAEPRCDRDGTVAVELAIVFPLVLLFVLGLMEFGRAIWAQGTLDYAVQAAARCAAIQASSCATTAQIQSYAASRSPGLAVSASNFEVSTQPCGRQVTATLPYQFTVPWLFPYDLALTASACFPT
jgi:Flp pilus assembly protein TadG